MNYQCRFCYAPYEMGRTKHQPDCAVHYIPLRDLAWLAPNWHPSFASNCFYASASGLSFPGHSEFYITGFAYPGPKMLPSIRSTPQSWRFTDHFYVQVITNDD